MAHRENQSMALCSGRVQSLHVDVDVEDVLAQAVCLYASFSGQ